ncbi:hypothetical protein HII13_002034 [Brettanomyces bruxellensis]|uniref:DEBR0S5_06480g1_1 n=1 Tax=Dekkera bruxellensis TaxID=5007 RepID=A0A3F2Y7K7_DEKBR|nr:uncharacterized protein BRETT_000283 [Brettanomyces bruxellensis]KAF6011570.1 hypothetical protein HII13_002034 [Brettanomyces bruxellensis]QOU20573.1 hypothetical protein BRETT_000283 [Brettanomyces bruxellensis]VUG19581.1 DEBR0S5_06480g1_1 [Brettanomyces bruxellensis]
MDKQRHQKFPSLVFLATLKCIENVHLITDVGTTPYHLVEPVLKKKTAKALRQIELKSPHLVSQSDPIWQSLIAREFPNRPLVVEQMSSGRKVRVPSRQLYEKYAREKEEQQKEATRTFKQLTRLMNKEKEKHKVKTIDHAMLPKRGMRLLGTSAPKPVFKSRLLEKARHQNKMRNRYLLSAIKKPKRSLKGGLMSKNAPFSPPKSFSRPIRVPRKTFINITDDSVRLRAPYPQLIPKKRRPANLSPPLRNASLTSQPKHKKSKVYIYSTQKSGYEAHN